MPGIVLKSWYENYGATEQGDIVRGKDDNKSYLAGHIREGKGQECDYDNWNISITIWETIIL